MSVVVAKLAPQKQPEAPVNKGCARGGMADTPDLGFFLDRFFGLLGLTYRIDKTIARQCVYDFLCIFQGFKSVLEK